MLKKTGVPSSAELALAYPPKERMTKGAVAIIECFQNIPCNPCATSCPRGAIKAFDDINDLPKFDPSLCNGCAICVANCPGLAIFVVDEAYSETESLIKLPYEFMPLPRAGDQVVVLSRAGEEIGLGKVLRVQNPASFDRTAVVHIVVPRAIAREARFLSVGVRARDENH